ncbi:antibiotic biosynthesis monooxygenase [Streptomyces sp. NPDC026673]|uniref:antibiotic biosynthesis monooxygenase n=1 Tax=Streptomyces sp. NPDC026673 TaxID=3155724 RepID=UPI00340675B3
MTNDRRAARASDARPMGRTGGSDAILLVERAVRPGHEESFQQWARDILEVAAAAPGHLGSGLFRPAEDGRPWIIVQRFRDNTMLRQWLDSPQRAGFFTQYEDHHHSEIARRELTGMDAWFPDPGPKIAAPPRWKIGVSSAIAIFPISLFGTGVLGPHLVGLPLVARTAVFTVLFSTLMTYVAIPAVSRLLRRWLRPALRESPVAGAVPTRRLRNPLRRPAEQARHRRL